MNNEENKLLGRMMDDIKTLVVSSATIAERTSVLPELIKRVRDNETNLTILKTQRENTAKNLRTTRNVLGIIQVGIIFMIAFKEAIRKWFSG